MRLQRLCIATKHQLATVNVWDVSGEQWEDGHPGGDR